MTALVAGIAVTGAFAQDPPADPCANIDAATALYDKFTASYNKKTSAEKKVALDAGKEFLEKYGACESWKDQVAFVKPWVPKLETLVPALIISEKLDPLYKRFDDGVKAKKWDEVYAAGKEIYAVLPNGSLDQLIPMGMIGLIESSAKPPNNKYNDDSIRFAKIAIDKLNAGEASTNGKFGVYQLAYLTKENSISELSFATAQITYNKGDKKNAVAQFYKVTQMPGSKKNFAPVFTAIGDFYVAEAEPIGKEIAEKIKTIQKPETPEEEKVKLNEEVKAKVALFNGYMERAMDAFGRAWSNVKDEPATKVYKDGLLKEVQRLYKLRFEKEDGVNQWITAAIAKPLPDPSSAVQPIADEPTTTTTTGTGTGVGAANGTGVGAANGKGVGAANGTGLGTPSGRTMGSAPAPAKPATAKPKP